MSDKPRNPNQSINKSNVKAPNKDGWKVERNIEWDDSGNITKISTFVGKTETTIFTERIEIDGDFAP
ncbi:Hypothetical protein HVR_LOCUS922 [uncultured virus]|nr:Hypothetical protein HVR_LOCUS922 [uncultured virus]